MSAPDEFEQIARLFRPLTRGAAEALDLLDDAAVIPSRPGFDLVITKDALVAGVHFQPDDPPDIIARRLMRANLSDLAAKGAEPYGYLLMTAWPAEFGWDQRQAFARGLDEDGQAFGVILLGGDTVSTPGPLTVCMTLLGWVPTGKMIRRAGAKAGDLVLVSGPIGDGWLDWGPGWGELDRRWLPEGHRLPTPRLDLREALRAHASAAADVSDGLIADAGHIAKASGVGMRLDLDRMPLSGPAHAWLATQDDPAAARLRLATGGDDYEIVCTAPSDQPALLGLTVIGEVVEGEGVEVRAGGAALEAGPGGWRHG
ncbi:thiamine-phosphate kinase [Phenylobacterium sp.]|uniref:thiamine-phosphate kinase n=1 Tax=Phenylobacterium sp. TaxID=1871053 RepID=UPI002721D36A|nr:thiamine-phosphate kinase [Phenylobacterium sp.]MDO8380151.1 thiamine-phosphate kinase [Phenylobacterium sp.]